MTYIKALDSLRAIAVFVVVFHHLPILPVQTPLNTIFNGVTGVDIFFVLSGFLITGILLSAKTRSENKPHILKSFYARRFLRIFPIYYATIFLLMLLNPHNYRADAVYDIFYISNFHMGIIGEFTAVTPHFWSLSVEEQFYLFWPLLVLLVPVRWEWPSFVLVAASGLISYIVCNNTGNSFYGARTFNNLLFLGAGGFWAYCFINITNKIKGKVARIASAYILLFILFGLTRYFYWFDLPRDLHYFSCFLFACALVCRFSVPFKGLWEKFASNRISVYLGKISYGIYVYHFLMIFPLVAILKHTWPDLLGNLYLSNMLKIVLCVITASLSWFLIERPLLRIKEKFTYK